TVCAHLERLKNPVAVIINGEHDDLNGRQDSAYLADTFDARHTRQVYIHENDLRRTSWQVLDRVFATAIAADGFQSLGFAQKRFHVGTPAGIIFDDGNFQGHVNSRQVFRVGYQIADGPRLLPHWKYRDCRQGAARVRAN